MGVSFGKFHTDNFLLSLCRHGSGEVSPHNSFSAISCCSCILCPLFHRDKWKLAASDFTCIETHHIFYIPLNATWLVRLSRYNLVRLNHSSNHIRLVRAIFSRKLLGFISFIYHLLPSIANTMGVFVRQSVQPEWSRPNRFTSIIMSLQHNGNWNLPSHGHLRMTSIGRKTVSLGSWRGKIRPISLYI